MISSDYDIYLREKNCISINKLDMSRISNSNTITSYLKQYPKVNK